MIFDKARQLFLIAARSVGLCQQRRWFEVGSGMCGRLLVRFEFENGIVTQLGVDFLDRYEAALRRQQGPPGIDAVLLEPSGNF